MKCATSSIFALLAGHPGICASTVKEPEFFCRERSAAELAGYRSLWRDALPGQLRLEGSTSYTKELIFPGTAARLHSAAPGARILYIVRDPIVRIESHWRHIAAIDPKVPELGEAVRTLPHLIDTSRYWKQLGQYRALFPDSRIKVCFFEDYKADPLSVTNDILRFLGLPRFDSIGRHETRHHVSADKQRDLPVVGLLQAVPGVRALGAALPGLKQRILPRLRRPARLATNWSPEIRRQTVDALREDTDAFLAHMGRDVSIWPSMSGHETA